MTNIDFTKSGMLSNISLLDGTIRDR